MRGRGGTGVIESDLIQVKLKTLAPVRHRCVVCDVAVEIDRSRGYGVYWSRCEKHREANDGE